jgi:hypothetical protein
VTLAPNGVGHAFPTGDLFRRLRVIAELSGGAGIAARRDRVLARIFTTREISPGVLARVEARDDRLLGEPRTVTLDLGDEARGRPIHVRVVYERAEGPATIRARDPVMGAIEIFRGDAP